MPHSTAIFAQCFISKGLKLNLKLKTGLNLKNITTKYIDILTNTCIELKESFVTWKNKTL